MSKKIEQTELEMTNGSSVLVSGTDEDIQNATFLVADWKAGNLPHKSMSQALLSAVAKVEPSVIIGEYDGKTVYDADAAWDKIIGAAIDTLDLQIEKSVATSRVGAKKKLDSVLSALTPEMRAYLKAQGAI